MRGVAGHVRDQRVAEEGVNVIEWLAANLGDLAAYAGCFFVGGAAMGLTLKTLAFDPLDRHAARLERELEGVQQRPTWPSPGSTGKV